MSFVNLHAHSHYSLLDGFGSPEAIILRAKELGYPAAALTDHGVTYGLIEFFKAGKKHGVKPILGCELYVAPRTRFDKDPKFDRKPYHLTAVAKNNIGYRNLLKMVSQAHLEGFYYKPRVDYDLLREHSEGIIVMSGCLAAHLPRTILSGNEEEMRKVINMYIEIFGKENYFLELQDHPLIDNQAIVNEKLKELAKEFGLPLIATNDSHYPRPEDREVHDVLLCIQTGSNVSDEQRMRYTGDFSIRAFDDLSESFKDCPEALSNTVKLAEMCDVDFDFGTNLIPSFDTPGSTPEEFLKISCMDGLQRRFEGKDIPKEYLERLDFELSLVNKMGFDTYFLIVADFVRYAKNESIVVGPGRGSAAGSIIAWSLNITDVDPIKYGLFFERFLNPERVSMPDIDIDFADHRRDEVLSYVIEKYGREKVAQIITFGTMAPRAAVRDVGRALGYPYQEVDTLAKTVPPPVLGKHTPLMESVKSDKELSKAYKGDMRAKALLDYAIQLEGTVRHVGTHACAVIISEKDLTEYTALQYGASGNEVVSQYSAGPLEELGLLKMDFLGLRNLTIIEKTLEFVKQRSGEEIDIRTIPMDDEPTFEMLQRGETVGVFQLESGGMRRYLKELKPTHFEDIVAMGALYRPGPMEWIPTYIAGKRNPDKVHYLHESFKDILSTTYGVAVYQEQILQLARDFAGFSLGEADILRKAVGKKIASLLAEQREKFVSGAVAQGHDEDFAREVFEKIVEPFAGYGFNRAHAVCYGLIAYQTAYLKAHYPIEFMTALMYSDAGNTDRIVLDIKECGEMGIAVLPPSINDSFLHFAIVDDKVIRFGLSSIKGVGEGPIEQIVEERERGGKFSGIEDFARRVPVKVLNKKTIQAFAYSGAFDEFGDRNQLAENYAQISGFAKSLQEVSEKGQTDIFGMMPDDDSFNDCPLEMLDFPMSTRMQQLKWEKELLGMYVSGHPMKGLGRYITRKAKLIASLKKKDFGKRVTVIGLVSGFRKIMTKNGAYMATFNLEDPSARVSAVVFPKVFAQVSDRISEDVAVTIIGKLDASRGQCQIVANEVKILSLQSLINSAKEAELFNLEENTAVAVPLLDDLLEDEDLAESHSVKEDVFLIEIPSSATPDKMNELKELLMNSKGDVPVDLFLKSANRNVRLPFGVELNDELKDKVASILA